MEENVNKTSFSWQIFSSFWLKIFAMIAMTLDHIGVLLIPIDSPWNLVFRIIGRLAIPLYAFMIAEGIKHTKNVWLYLLKNGIMATFISIALLIAVECNILPEMRTAGNIFLDLTLGILGGYLLIHKNKGLRWLALLPLLFAVGSTIVVVYENETGALVHWFPYWLRTQYDFFAIALIYSFVLAGKLKDLFFRWYCQKNNLPEDTFDQSQYNQLAMNIIAILFLVIIQIIYYVVSMFYQTSALEMQSYSILAGVFILLYNGKRGYNKKWFQYSAYLYYPVHIGIIALIYLLIG